MPLVFGMTIFAGVVECALARIMPFLRPIFPPEVAGLIILLIGLTNGTIGVRNLLGIGAAQPLTGVDLAIGLAELRRHDRAERLDEGPVARLLRPDRDRRSATSPPPRSDGSAGPTRAGADQAPLANLPGFSHLGWSFDAAFAITFAVAAVSATTKAMGAVTSYQKLNDAAWVRPNMRSVSGGVLADGLATVGAGLFGSIGMNPSASRLGLTTATGSLQPAGRLAIGGIFVMLAFLPKVAMADRADPEAGDRRGARLHRRVHPRQRHRDHQLSDAGRPPRPGHRRGPRRRRLDRRIPGVLRGAARRACGRSSTTRSPSGHSWRWLQRRVPHRRAAGASR